MKKRIMVLLMLSMLMASCFIWFGGYVCQSDTEVKIGTDLAPLPLPLGRFRGAITAVGPVATNGSISVDGRCYDINGNFLTAAQKTADDVDTNGISTESASVPDVGGSSQVGGNGVAPGQTVTNTPPAGTYEISAPIGWRLPHEVLGFPTDAALRAHATVHTTVPTPPIHGVNYVTADEWTGMNFGTAANPSTGVLIMHNTSSTALLKNLHGVFKGIIICDDLVHINGDAEIIGASFCLKTSGNVIGNGSAWVKYSPAAIKKAGEDYGAGQTFANVKKGTWEKNKK